MKAMNINSVLNFTYQKSSTDIVTKAKAKIVAISAKIKEREGRIERLRKEHGISEEMISEFLQRFRSQAQGATVSYSIASNEDDAPVQQVVGAGAINHLLTERDFIVSERAQVDKLEMIVRNLEDVVHHEGGVAFKLGHRLTCQELEYLGF